MDDPMTGRAYSVGTRLPEAALGRYRQTAIEIAGRAVRQDPGAPSEVLSHLREAYRAYAAYRASRPQATAAGAVRPV